MTDFKKYFTRDFIKKHKLFFGFTVMQFVILLFAFTGLFGKAVNMELDASNLDIADPKVVVGDDNSMYINGRDDLEPFGRWIAGTGPFDLRDGVYEVSVDYWSLLYDSEIGGNCEDGTGLIQIIRTKQTEDKLCYNDLALKDGWESQKTRLWIRDIGGEKGLLLKVNYCGLGELRIDKITVRELTAWRFMKFMAWIFAFVTVDMILWYFFLASNAQGKTVTVLLIMASFLSSLPLLTDSLFWGHDINFHLTRIAALADGLASGHIFVPIQTEVLNGYGYAAPLFYSQLFLYLPALLYNMAVPMQTCYQIYAFFANIATVLIAYYSFNGIARDKKIAATGAFIYTLSAYRVTNLHIRAAVGEYTAMVFFPLIVYGFVRIYAGDGKKPGMRDYLPIVIGLTGLIESHVLSCEMAVIFIAATCIANFKKTFSPGRFLALAKAAALTLLVNMAFILPFIDSMQMSIRVNKAPVDSIQMHGAYLQQIFSAFPVSDNISRWGMLDEMSLSLGFALVLGGAYSWLASVCVRSGT